LQIRIGSGFTDFLDPDGAKMLDPDPDWIKTGSTFHNPALKDGMGPN
jgi:hypothetical protein